MPTYLQPHSSEVLAFQLAVSVPSLPGIGPRHTSSCPEGFIKKYLQRQTSHVFNQATNTSWLTLITSWTLDPVHTLLITSWLENQFLTCSDPFTRRLGLEFHALWAPPWSWTGRSWLFLWLLGLSLLTFTLIAPSLLIVYNFIIVYNFSFHLVVLTPSQLPVSAISALGMARFYLLFW